MMATIVLNEKRAKDTSKEYLRPFESIDKADEMDDILLIENYDLPKSSLLVFYEWLSEEMQKADNKCVLSAAKSMCCVYSENKPSINRVKFLLGGMIDNNKEKGLLFSVLSLAGVISWFDCMVWGSVGEYGYTQAQCLYNWIAANIWDCYKKMEDEERENVKGLNIIRTLEMWCKDIEKPRNNIFAWENAIGKGLLEEKGGEIIWHRNKTLLAYFIGKISCGDCIVNGLVRLGEKKLCVEYWDSFSFVVNGEQYNAKKMASLRRRNHHTYAPQGYEEIDCLFDEEQI